MKIIFEYEDGTYRVLPHISLLDIESRTVNNRLIDQYVCDRDLKHKYMVSDDSRLAGFGQHKDIAKVKNEIEELQRMITLKEKVLEYYSAYENLTLNEEKTSITVEESAVNELFNFAVKGKKHVLYTS